MRSLLFAVVLVSACGKNSEPPPPSSGSPNAQPESGPSHPRPRAPSGTQAERMFATVCITCHGSDGRGHGPAADALNPKPRDYTDAAWQASVTDQELRDAILKGGAGVGKSPMMPGQPQLADQPEVLDGLVQIIRKFGKQP